MMNDELLQRMLAPLMRGVRLLFGLMRRAINESNPRDKCGPISLSNTAS